MSLVDFATEFMGNLHLNFSKIGNFRLWKTKTHGHRKTKRRHKGKVKAGKWAAWYFACSRKPVPQGLKKLESKTRKAKKVVRQKWEIARVEKRTRPVLYVWDLLHRVDGDFCQEKPEIIERNSPTVWTSGVCIFSTLWGVVCILWTRNGLALWDSGIYKSGILPPILTRKHGKRRAT